jgi:outer membrane protein assembly factor BamB
LGAAAALSGTVTFAQVGRGGSEWLTAYGDGQRTSWIRTDPKISLDTMSKPGFALQWTSRLDNQTRQQRGLAQGVTANGVTLFVPMSIVTGSSNNVYAIDNDTGYLVWQRQFEGALPAATAACPGGITSAGTRIVSLAPPSIAAPAAAGRGGRGVQGYRSLLGEPGEGVPVEGRAGGAGRGAAAPPVGVPGAAGAGRGAGRGAAGAGVPPAPGAPPAAAPGAARGGGGQGGRGAPQQPGIPGAPASLSNIGGLARPSGVAYVISGDGLLRVVGLPSGKDIQPPAPFVPANSRWSDPVAVGTMLYAATMGDCGGAPNAVWAIDLDSASKPVVSWRTNGGPVVGPVAITPSGTLIAAIGAGQTTADGKANAIVALDSKTLQLRDWYTHPTAEFVTGPMVFSHNDTEIVAAATRDGRILLLDAASLGGADHATPMYASPPVTGTGASLAGNLATWQQATITPAPAGAPATAATVTAGHRWILAPISGRATAGAPATNGAAAAGSVLALRLTQGADGAIALEPGWSSHNLTTPATPITVNGVVFALSTGRPATTAGRTAPAVLYAYDGATGKALWNSRQSMSAFASPGSFWSAMGQMYVGTNDGTLYAFGFLDERR